MKFTSAATLAIFLASTTGLVAALPARSAPGDLAAESGPDNHAEARHQEEATLTQVLAERAPPPRSTSQGAGGQGQAREAVAAVARTGGDQEVSPRGGRGQKAVAGPARPEEERWGQRR